jgi:aryl-alcohol dehydrogenase-like predicted oxidoreductase
LCLDRSVFLCGKRRGIKVIGGRYNAIVNRGQATADGTAAYAERFPGFRAAGFFRSEQGLSVSSVGLGTYLGQPDERTNRMYEEAVTEAARGGINFFDTAINYRHQRSERAVGAALARLFAGGQIRRNDVVVATKAGFLTPGAVPDWLEPRDIVGRMHSMAPDFLADQIDRSRTNLQLDTIDVFYLHNPETQLQFVSREEFERRIRAAFACLERLVAEGKIAWYGTATWDGYRVEGKLDLDRLARIAAEEAGADNHFRFVQLPFNLGMVEAIERRPESVLEAAQRLGITVVASASLLQARLTRELPEAVAERLPGLATDAQRALQFTRSAPGIAVALAGMSQAEHVRENLGVAPVPPATGEQFLRLFQE